MTFDNLATPECTECGEDMVRRKNKTTGEEFWGCPMYPQCDGTESIESGVQKGNYPDWARNTDQ